MPLKKWKALLLGASSMRAVFVHQRGINPRSARILRTMVVRKKEAADAA